MRSHVTVAILVALSRPSDAQEGTAAPDRVPIEQLDLESLLDAPVTTASGGVVEERAVAPANVISFDRAEIQRRGWRSLADVLANVPGVYVVDDHVIPSVGVRGVTGGIRAGTRIVKIMINGVAVNFRPELTAFIGPEYIPMEAVERIEIAQGPLSALYGANAFLATVNVITRRGAPGLTTEAAGRVNAVRSHVGGGFSTFAAHADEDSGMVAAVSIDRFDRSGVAVRETFEAQDPTLDRYRGFFGRVSEGDVAEPISGFLQYYVGRRADLGVLTVQGGVQRQDAIGEFQLNGALTGKTRSSIVNAWSDVRHEKDWSSAVSSEANVGFSAGTPTRDDRLYLTGNENAYWTRNMNYWAVEGGGAVTWSPLAEELRVQLGAEAEVDRERMAYYTEHFLVPVGEREAGEELDLIGSSMKRKRSLFDVGAKLQVSSTPSPGLHLTGNVRLDYLRYGAIEFPLEPSARAAVSYRLSEDLVVKLVGGHAFQAPSSVLMFAHPGYGTANNLIGNVDVHDVVGIPELRPQTVNSAELIGSAGLDVATVEAGAYYQEIRDAIEFQPVATDFVAANGETRRSVGGIATARGGARLLQAYASVAVMREIDPPDGQAGPPPLYPNAFGNVGLDVDLSEWKLLGNVNLRWVGERGASDSNIMLNNSEPYTLEAYQLLDVTVSTVDLHPFADGSTTTLVLAAKNLLNARYSEPGFGGFDVPNLGRFVWIEVRQRY